MFSVLVNDIMNIELFNLNKATISRCSRCRELVHRGQKHLILGIGITLNVSKSIDVIQLKKCLFEFWKGISLYFCMYFILTRLTPAAGALHLE